MDVVAHGLWGGVPFYRLGRRKFFAGILIGMAPDLLSFGVFHVLYPDWITLRLAGKISGPPALSILPPYVFHSYNITHSLFVLAAAFCLLWLLTKNPPWLLGAWLLHILCDIPTHTESYFPTPFLWPLATPFVNGIAWSTPWFMIANYATILSVYAATFFYFYRRRRE
ncbi:MAG: hypothetical protein ACREQ2_02630 [Candidatus Binatia bacterium]